MSSPELMFTESAKYTHLIRKLVQFRRHPDWNAAFKKIAPRYTVPVGDGRSGILEKDLNILFETADQEFIDEIIRRGG